MVFNTIIFLVCSPVPEISWVRLEEDKTTVMKTIKHGEDGFEFAQDRRTLKIPVVSKEQHERGYYQCIAKNKIANVVKTAKTHLTKLEVFGKCAYKYTVNNVYSTYI